MMTPRNGRAWAALLVPAALLFAGCGDSNNPMTPAPDTTPPAVPVGLQLSSLPNQLQLTWTPNSEPDLAGYRVVQSTDAGVTWNDASTSLLTTATLDTPKGADVQFRVSALDFVGNESAYSSAVGYVAPNHDPKFRLNEAGIHGQD